MGHVGWFELRMEEENRKFEDTIPQRKNLKFWFENKLWSSPYNIIQHIYFIRISILPHCDISTEKDLKAFLSVEFKGKNYNFRQFRLTFFQILLFQIFINSDDILYANKQKSIVTQSRWQWNFSDISIGIRTQN